MSEPYRIFALTEPLPVSEPKAHLVRYNGSICTCTPPNWLWCWWFHVVIGDQWVCKHGGGWERVQQETYPRGPVWQAVPTGSTE